MYLKKNCILSMNPLKIEYISLSRIIWDNKTFIDCFSKQNSKEYNLIK